MATPPRRRLPLPAIAAVMSIVVLAALALLLVSRGDDEPEGTRAAEPQTASGAPLVVLAEFSQTADEVFVAPADRPADRRSVAAVEHAPGWGINPAPEMAGSLVAYTVLPPDARPRRDSPAELWLLDVASGERIRLARDADLLAAPALARDGSAVVYRSSDGTTQELIRVDIESRARRVLHSVRTEFGVFPVAVTPAGQGAGGDGSGAELLFSQISTAGTDLYAVSMNDAVGSEPRHLLRASPQIARDWRLAPDGTTLSYLAPEPVAERVVHRLHVVTLDGDGASEQQPPLGDGSEAAEQYGPVWTPDGAALTVGREAAPSPTAAAVTLPLEGDAAPIALSAPEAGFDVPLGWSPDGRTLAARSFDGRNSADPGADKLTLIDLAGGRRTVDSATELIFLGWWTRG